jgi:hypothetical protein
LIGSGESKQAWNNASLATISSPVDCGAFFLQAFYTKSGGTKLPLDSKVFVIDFSSSSILIKCDDASKAGTFQVFYDVAMSKYPTNLLASSSSFKVVLTKPNTAPTLSGLATKAQQVTVTIPFPAADQTISVGKPTDVDGDKVTTEFQNNGNMDLAYDEAKGVVTVAKSAKDGTYSATIKVKDDNTSGPLTTTYSLTIKVTVTLADLPATNSTATANDTQPSNKTATNDTTTAIKI